MKRQILLEGSPVSFLSWLTHARHFSGCPYGHDAIRTVLKAGVLVTNDATMKTNSCLQFERSLEHPLDRNSRSLLHQKRRVQCRLPGLL